MATRNIVQPVRTKFAPRAPDAGPARFEPLEHRLALSGFGWSSQEVYLSELVNRARSDPFAEGARLHLDLTAGLTAAEAARLVPSEPLALNPFLTLAARAHSLDMANRDFFDHVNPDGLNPTQRAQNAGYVGTAGENIAAGYSSIDEAHAAWLESVGHRKNVLSLHSNFTSTFHYDEFGPGFAFTSIAPFFDYYTEEFGVQGGTPDLFLLGVVFDDLDSDAFYSVGEGRANVRIDVARTSDPSVVIGSYTTDAAGNYQLPLLAGNYTVTFTNLNTNLVLVRSASISNVNVELSTTADLIVDSPGGGPVFSDDHANAGAFNQATILFVDSTSGDGVGAGIIDPASDTDLFRFTAAAPGTLTVSIVPAHPITLAPTLDLFGATQNALGPGVPDANGVITFTLSVAQGQTYFALIGSADGSLGAYFLTISGPGQSSSGGGGGSGDGTVPPPSAALIAAPNATLYGSALNGGRLTLTTINSLNRPIAFQQNGAGGTWTATDLLTRAGGSSVIGEPITWTDPKDATTYVASRSDAGLLLFTNHADGSWTFRNLTAEIPDSALISGPPTYLITRDHLVLIAGLDPSGNLVAYSQTGASTASGFTWTFYDITQNDLVPQGLRTPDFSGPLISYVTTWNALTIAGLDSNGAIRAVWFAPGLPRWTSSNLSASTGAPALAGGLTAYLTAWGGINIGGVDASGRVLVAWWVPGFRGDWRLANLTHDAGGPLLTAGSSTSYVTSWGGLNIVGTDNAGRLVSYWWSPAVRQVFGHDVWQVTILSDAVSGARPLPSGRLTGINVGTTVNIAGITSAGNVVRYWWTVGGSWHAENISDIATPI